MKHHKNCRYTYFLTISILIVGPFNINYHNIENFSAESSGNIFIFFFSKFVSCSYGFPQHGRPYITIHYYNVTQHLCLLSSVSATTKRAPYRIQLNWNLITEPINFRVRCMSSTEQILYEKHTANRVLLSYFELLWDRKASIWSETIIISMILFWTTVF